ncbi:hypothetical protein HAX54_006790 [Datura stramonium]|uniref:Uncharacterized protein n=1 Tax=Datura stramonium TaxID=4076 RepID=A0ABS8WZ14_DATST|nr:hypothetical protein [Datura stramonium]
MPQSSHHEFAQANFTRVVRKVDRQDKHQKLFAEQLGPFVDRAITPALEIYKHFRTRMDDMEARVNDRLMDLTGPELARVEVELKKAQNDILKLQQERQHPEFLIVEFEELEDDAPFIDLLGKQPKETAKTDGGDSSSSAPRVEGHVIGDTIHLESTTHITLPPATEAAMSDPLSATTATEGIADGSGVIPPQTVVPDSRV